MRPGFFNDNINRSYPFITATTTTVPNYAVADFGCWMNAGSGFVEGQHNVYLTAVRVVGTDVKFVFTSDAPGLVGTALVFWHDSSSPDFTSSYVDAIVYDGEDASSSSSSSSSTSLIDENVCDVEPLWAGFLCSGDITRLLDFLGSDVLENAGTVEPSRIQNNDGAYVRSVNLANAERTRATTHTDCKDYCWSFPHYDHYVAGYCLTGPIKLREGYNTSIRQDALSNTITIDASLGAGAGQPCEEVPLFNGETPPSGRTTLDGAPKCNEIVRSINGVGKRFFEISGGNGVVITPVPAEHKVIVSVDLQDLAFCPDLRDMGSLGEHISFGDDACDCGPLPEASASSSSSSSSLGDQPIPL